jgi:hypothetical protein
MSARNRGDVISHHDRAVFVQRIARALDTGGTAAAGRSGKIFG